MMKIHSHTGDQNLAWVLTASFDDNQSRMIEFVDAKDPELPRSEKWVIIVSTQFGCPIGCRMCDSGTEFFGNLTAEQIFSQIDHAVSLHQNHRNIDCKKFKIQFARMGEPSLNPSVLEVLTRLPEHYDAPGLIPCIATTMPKGSSNWFEELLQIKQDIYANNLFQLQVSINSTDSDVRDWLMPHPKWSFEQIARYGNRFVKNGDRKIGLNFAWTDEASIEPDIINRYFNPDHFCIKITPLNPTYAVQDEKLKSAFEPHMPDKATLLCNRFTCLGYETILSIGDVRENEIGSNCGMSVRKFKSRRDSCTPW